MNEALQRQRGALMPWSAVFLGLGVGLYFALPVEPPFLGLAVFCAGSLALGLARWRHRDWAGPLGAALVLISLGVLAGSARMMLVTGPVLDMRYYGPIEGRIVGIDRSASDRLRLTLDQVRLEGVGPADTPLRVRVSLHGTQGFLEPVPGALIGITGHLSAPEGPGEPGGFDFQRHAWFLSLGAVGYTRVPALILQEAEPGALPLLRLRYHLSQAVQARIPGQAGAFAAAVLTGDRSGVSRELLDDLRHSNIAHLLAISGLHMGLLTGFVFLCLRSAVALSAPLALRLSSKKIAAIGALGAGAAYLAIAGGNVATERAFIQVAVMFTAVMLDRRAITLRSVAIAAIIVLLRRPETLLGPGFQMSFAATIVLVFIFNQLKDNVYLRMLPKWGNAITGLVLSSLVAGLATAPFAAAHFNLIAAYGLPANLATVPVMGFLVIPAAVVALLLWPFGLEWVAFAAMEWGLEWIMFVAARISSLPGALRMIAMPPGGVLPLLTIGALFVILWQGRLRMLGAIPMLFALLFWSFSQRPALLIASNGAQVGVMTGQGRSLSRPRGAGFVTRLWLENDGDASDQESAAARWGWQEDGAGQRAQFGPLQIWHGTGRRAEEDIPRACSAHDWVITNVMLSHGASHAEITGAAPFAIGQSENAPAHGCTIMDMGQLRQTGALAIYQSTGGYRVVSARNQQGARPWARAR